MIVGVPDHRILYETSYGWLNLAWDIAIEEARTFQHISFVLDEIAKDSGNLAAEQAEAKHWRAKRLTLNNAVSLLQQSLEIFLKAKIAEVSPYLLISGEPSSWPKSDANGEVDFSNFRTLDAVQLCRAVNIVGKSPMKPEFTQFYERMRQARNRIVHLNAASIKTEVKSLVIDILTAQHFMDPSTRWTLFRKNYLYLTEEYHDKDNLFSGDDFTGDAMIGEVETAIEELDNTNLKKFFYFNPKQAAYRCPGCLATRSQSDSECEFVQMQKNGTLLCAVCTSTYDVEEYKESIIAHFGYLDDDEQKEIQEELNRIRTPRRRQD